jgi:hypothetical protein
MTKFRTRFALILVGIGAIAALAASPPSRAEGGVLEPREIRFGDTYGVSFICQSWLDDGMTPINIAATTDAVSQVGGFPGYDSGDVIRYATYRYCPEYVDGLESVVEQAHASSHPTFRA